ncbi:MAG: hypothetical protein H6624_15335 [Bdellovibrionaceae bacterium]|nr:hypothetical protein [Bdellovibrionales bacterium]MCB9085719.1 hypothetical protein [Pseudobdellovibrionaceae bacterium]
MKTTLKTLLCLLVFALFGCVTPEPAQPPPPEDPYRPDRIGGDAVRAIPKKRRVNMDSLQEALRMGRSFDNLGFEEKRFNTCKVGSGYSDKYNCENLYFAVLHFRFQCRDSEGTVESVSMASLSPLSSTRLEWKVGLFEGLVTTDRDGFGQIRFISPGSSRNQSLRFVARPNSMRLGVGDARRIIAPNYWCRHFQ